MISRLMLSLKKASKARESGWTSNTLSGTHPRIATKIAFRNPPIGPEDGGSTTLGEVALADLSVQRVGGGSSVGAG